MLQEGRALIVAINKWDVAENASSLFNGIKAALDEGLAQARGVPLLTVSGMTGKGIDQLLGAAFEVREIWSKRVSTGQLNRWFEEAVEKNPPPAPGGKRIKLRYITQVNTRPPSFVLFGTRVDQLPDILPALPGQRHPQGARLRRGAGAAPGARLEEPVRQAGRLKRDSPYLRAPGKEGLSPFTVAPGRRRQRPVYPGPVRWRRPGEGSALDEDEATIVDWAKFAQMRTELGASFVRILGYFREDGEKAVAKIEQAMHRRDAAALVLPAHTLKAEARQFGAEPVAELAEEIEQAGRRGVEGALLPRRHPAAGRPIAAALHADDRAARGRDQPARRPPPRLRPRGPSNQEFGRL